VGVWGGGGGLRERHNVEDLWVDGRMILKRIFRKWDVGLKWIYLTYKHGNESSRSTKRGKFLDYLWNC